MPGSPDIHTDFKLFHFDHNQMAPNVLLFWFRSASMAIAKGGRSWGRKGLLRLHSNTAESSFRMIEITPQFSITENKETLSGSTTGLASSLAALLCPL